MTIEKLQEVATTHVDASFKARWLWWWNSPAEIKTKNKFPSLLLREKVLDDWLYKASFWAQVHQYLFLSYLFFFNLRHKNGVGVCGDIGSERNQKWGVCTRFLLHRVGQLG